MQQKQHREKSMYIIVLQKILNLSFTYMEYRWGSTDCENVALWASKLYPEHHRRLTREQIQIDSDRFPFVYYRLLHYLQHGAAKCWSLESESKSKSKSKSKKFSSLFVHQSWKTYGIPLNKRNCNISIPHNHIYIYNTINSSQ